MERSQSTRGGKAGRGVRNSLMESLLLIDWDGVSVGELDALHGRCKLVVESLWPGRAYTVKVVRSSGGDGFHGVVSIKGPKISRLNILMGQVLCGSDWGRELHNLRRIKAGVKDWNILFESKLEEL